MAEPTQNDDKKYKTRQLVAGVIMLAALFALVTTLVPLAGAWLASTIYYAFMLFALLILGRIARATERHADAAEKLAQRHKEEEP